MQACSSSVVQRLYEVQIPKLRAIRIVVVGKPCLYVAYCVQLQVRVRDVARYRLIPRATADAETRDGGARRAREPGGTFRER